MKKKRRTNLSTKTKNIKPQKIIKKEEPKVICENKAFFFNNGPNITNMSGLISHLKICENQDFKHHVNEYKNELNLSWIHIEPGFLNELTGHEDLNDIRLYLDTFTIIDTYLGASEYSDDPEPLLLEAKTRFDQILKDGAMGMGSNYGTYMIQYLLSDY